MLSKRLFDRTTHLICLGTIGLFLGIGYGPSNGFAESTESVSRIRLSSADESTRPARLTKTGLSSDPFGLDSRSDSATATSDGAIYGAEREESDPGVPGKLLPTSPSNTAVAAQLRRKTQATGQPVRWESVAQNVSTPPYTVQEPPQAEAVSEPIGGRPSLGQTTESTPLSENPEPRLGQPDPIPLAPPEKADQKVDETDRFPGSGGGVKTFVTTGGALILVLGLFFLFAWTLRRNASGPASVLPKEVVEVLGRAPLACRQQVYLLRLGHRLVLVSVTPSGIETLSEIDDPLEVDRLAGYCQQRQGKSSTQAFRQIFNQFDGKSSDVSPARSVSNAEYESAASAGSPASQNLFSVAPNHSSPEERRGR